MLELYRNIRKRRESLGYTQQELAEKTGYKDRTSIAKIESGKIDLPQSKILAFADALKTTPSELMGWDDEVHTIAAHHEGDEWTDEELQEIEDFKKYIISKRKKIEKK